MTHPSSPQAPMTASRLRELMEEATPGPFVITTNMDFWIAQADHPDDNGFYGVAHCGDISWPKSKERQQEWEANARLIALLLNNATTILRLLEAVEGAEKALEFIARQKTSSEIWGVCLSKKDRGYRVPRDTTYLFDVVVGRARDALATLLAAREVKP